MKEYLKETYLKQIKEYRKYESIIDTEWGGKKRLFKCINIELEIKFCKAQMLFDESLKKQSFDKKIQMIAMMYRAWSSLIGTAKSNGFCELDNDHRCYKYRDNKIAIVCDSDLQLSNLKSVHGKDKDVILFSMEELFRFVHPDYIDAKEVFKKRDIDITFKRVSYVR